MTLRHHLHICLHLSCGAVLSLEPFLFLPSPLFYVWHLITMLQMVGHRFVFKKRSQIKFYFEQRL